MSSASTISRKDPNLSHIIYIAKQRIRFLLFPEGITYNKKTDECRTPRINSVFAYVAYFQ